MAQGSFLWPNQTPTRAPTFTPAATQAQDFHKLAGSGTFYTLAQAGYHSVAEAQARLTPRVTSLSDGLDWACLQASADAAMASGSREWKPEGAFLLDRPPVVNKSYTVVRGGGSEFRAYTAPAAQPARIPLLHAGPYGDMGTGAGPMAVPTTTVSGMPAFVCGGNPYPALAGPYTNWLNFGGAGWSLDGATAFCLRVNVKPTTLPTAGQQHVVFGANGSLDGTSLDTLYGLQLGLIHNGTNVEWRFAVNVGGTGYDTYLANNGALATNNLLVRLTVDYDSARGTLLFWVGSTLVRTINVTGAVVQKWWHDFVIGLQTTAYPDYPNASTVPSCQVAGLDVTPFSLYSTGNPPSGVAGPIAYAAGVTGLWCDFGVIDGPFVQFKSSSNTCWTALRVLTENSSQGNVSVRDLRFFDGSEGLWGDSVHRLNVVNCFGFNCARGPFYLWNQCYTNNFFDCEGQGGKFNFGFANNSTFAGLFGCKGGAGPKVNVLSREAYRLTIAGGWFQGATVAGVLSQQLDGNTTVVGAGFDDESAPSAEAVAGLWLINHDKFAVENASLFYFSSPRPHVFSQNCASGKVNATFYSHASTAERIRVVDGSRKRWKIRDVDPVQIGGQTVPASLSSNVVTEGTAAV